MYLTRLQRQLPVRSTPQAEAELCVPSLSRKRNAVFQASAARGTLRSTPQPEAKLCVPSLSRKRNSVFQASVSSLSSPRSSRAIGPA
ncbi:Hypothetical predicted protein [Pelobates cultripes]|uniref:Uncharacterized protein n=1 Tax=Pelobates cultripes TaxID=61616 RepID=A0AAD1WGK4_PELCU|nr:Hypothetical predicted protein [Pelobates cultripes]